MSEYTELELELPNGAGPSSSLNSPEEDPYAAFQQQGKVDVGGMGSPQAVLQLLQADVPGTVKDSVTQSAIGMIHHIRDKDFINETWIRICNISSVNRSMDMAMLPSICFNETVTESIVDYSDSAAMERTLSIVVPIIFGLIVVVGLFGNALVVVVVLCNPQQMRSTTNLLIINLAMADLLFIVFCVPFTASDYALPYWPFGDIWCRVVQYLVIVCAYASIYTLVLMSLDRFLAVVHPIASMSWRTERNAYTAITFTWIAIVLLCIPALYAHGELVYFFSNTEYSICTFLGTEGYNLFAYQIAFFLSSYIIPLAIIFVLYVLMLKRLWFGVGPVGHVSAESVRSKKRVTRLVVVVVVIFAVCWCPIQVILVLKSMEAYEMNDPKRVALQIASHVLAYMNSCVNPILYAFLSENFRKAFRKVISCNPQRAGRFRRDDFEKTERDTMGNAASTATKTSKVSNDIL